MRFVRLNMNGPRGMTPQVACQHMAAAKIAAGNTPGDLMISPVTTLGDFLVIFENHAHATRFIDFLGTHGVARQQFTALPSGLSLRDVTAQGRRIMPIPPGIMLMMIDGDRELRASLFATPLR